MCKIAVNKSIEFLRKSKKINQVCFEIENLPDSADVSELANRFSTFDECIDYLPETYQVLFILRYGLELSYNDISFATDISVGTIKGTFFRIKNILRQKFFASTTNTSIVLQKGEQL